jgi:hypothetical protein
MNYVIIVEETGQYLSQIHIPKNVLFHENKRFALFMSLEMAKIVVEMLKLVIHDGYTYRINNENEFVRKMNAEFHGYKVH